MQHVDPTCNTNESSGSAPVNEALVDTTDIDAGLPVAGSGREQEAHRDHEDVAKIPLVRLPLYQHGRSVWGYVLAVTNRVSPVPAEREQAVLATYADLQVPELALDRPVLLWATETLIDGTVPLPEHSGALGLLIQSRHTLNPDMPEHLARLMSAGVMTVLFDYRGTREQNALLRYVSHVMIDFANPDQLPLFLANSAQAAGVRVIAENLTSEALKGGWPEGADLVMGSVFGNDQPERELTAGEVQCLEAVRLLSEDDVDANAVATVLGADPAMTVRVLRLVNAATEGVSRRIDSLQQAIILLGPTRVSGLVMASLISSTVKNVDNLWLLIARGAACRELAGDDAAYTVGLLSALSDEAGIPGRTLVEQTRVSPAVATAIVNGEGRLGRILDAVIAHEQDDEERVAATGFAAEAVALAYLKAIPWALSTVISAVSLN